MNTRKYKILCDGLFIGFIFISDSNPRFPNCIVATIWPFERQGKWTAGDLKLVGQRAIIDLYEMGTNDEEIQNDLTKRANFSHDTCKKFETIAY